MRVLLQRVRRAEVRVDEDLVGRIGPGLLLLVGIGPGDDRSTLSWMAQKVVGLRVFRDDEGLMNRSLLEVEGEVLVVSQFTLHGDCRKGRRPSFVGAAPPDEAAARFDEFVELVREQGPKHVATGRFGANMQVELINDGPVTLWIERGE